MSVSVTPQQFNYVAFDADLIQRVAEELLSSLGLADRDVHIEVDETTPLARTARRDRRDDLDPCREWRIRRHQTPTPAE